MEALTQIAPGLDTAALLVQVHVAPDSEDAATVTALIDRAREVARPKALYAEAFVEGRGDDTVRIGGVTFSSRMLRRKLDTVERVFPYVATCGHEMDSVPLPAGDVLVQYRWDSIKAELLASARAHLLVHLTERFRLGQTARMSPGSGDVETWPIEQQRQLFSLLDGVTPHIGVVLTESCLMIPNKTVSGILFPTQEDFQTCQVCHRDPCPNRRAPFDAALWQALRKSDLTRDSPSRQSHPPQRWAPGQPMLTCDSAYSIRATIGTGGCRRDHNSHIAIRHFLASLAALREAIVFDFDRFGRPCRGRSATPNVQPTAWSPSSMCDELGAVIVSSILGENVKAAADKAYAAIVKIMAKTEGK